MLDLVEQITKFENFQKEILPKLQEMVQKGKSSKDIMEFAKSYAAARVATIALTDPDSAKALTAAKDIIDRTDGKATDKKEVSHRFQNLPEEQVDSILASKLARLEENDTDDKAH